MPPGPPPGMVVKARQVSWLAARTPAAPSRPEGQWHGRRLAAHSCGGSAGVAPASLFARGITAGTRAPRRCGGGPPVSTAPAAPRFPVDRRHGALGRQARDRFPRASRRPGIKRERGAPQRGKTAAAPATVSGERRRRCHWEFPGRPAEQRPASQETCRSPAGPGRAASTGRRGARLARAGPRAHARAFSSRSSFLPRGPLRPPLMKGNDP